MAHDGTNLLLGNRQSELDWVDDGIFENANYASLSNLSGTVNSGSTGTITATFNANGLTNGTYTGTITVSSNDPNNVSDEIPYTLTVDANPILSVSTPTLNFGSVIAGAISTKILWVKNTGCSTLSVSDISSTAETFTIDATSFDVEVGDSARVMVAYAPTSAGSYNAMLTISSNAEAAKVFLTGTAIAPPVLSVTPSAISATITECGGSATQTFAIANTGTTALTYTNSVESSGAGDILESYSNFKSGNTGMVIVGNYIYEVNYNNSTLDKYDASAQQVVASYPIFNEPVGITYDGQYLWIGYGSSGKIYNFDLSGNQVGGSITLPFNSYYTSLTYDGQYFIVAPNFTANPSIYKIDHSGTVIESYNLSIPEVYQFTWVPEHVSGHLWATYNNDIIQINLSGKTAEIVKSFSESASQIYSIAHDGIDLWYADWNGNLKRVDDGIYENGNWINLSNYSGTVATGASATITATFNANGKAAGTYTGNIVVGSNDPVNTISTVAYTLTVAGSPAINLSATSFNFGDVFNGQTVTDTLWVKNTGCDTLKVSGISGLTDEFTVNATTFNVLGYDSAQVIINFAPVSISSYNATLTITSNVANATITLSGKGIDPPVLSVNPIFLNVSADCGASSDKTFTITNNGASDLTYTNTISCFNFDPAKAGNILNNYANFPSPSPGMVMVGKYLYIIIFNMPSNSYLAKYDTETQQIVSTTNIHSAPFGIAYDGQHLWIGSISSNQVYSYNLDGNATGSSFTLPFSGMTGLAYDGQYLIALSRSASNPTFYRVDNSGAVIDSYTSSFGTIYGVTWATKHNALWLWNSGGQLIEATLTKGVVTEANRFNLNSGNPIYSLAHDGTNLWCGEVNGNLYTVDDGIDENVKYLILSSNGGTLTSSNSSTITATFNASGMNAGIYTGEILIKSNDPLNAADTVTYSFTVAGEPAINLSATTLNFGDVINGQAATNNLWVRNTGCDTLKVSNITGSTSEFTIEATAFNVLPYDSTQVAITFIPTTTGSYSATLTFTSNAADATISLSGTGVEPPVLLVTPQTITASITGCNGSTTGTFAITNNGSADLNYANSIVTSGTGNILGSYAGYSTYPRGMVLVGNYLYVVNYDDYAIDKYDFTTKTKIASYPVSFEAYGITYDGQYLWVGNYDNMIMYNYDLSGNAMGSSINLPVSYPVLAYDGQYFVMAERWNSNPNIYKVDHSGNVIQTFSSSGIGDLADFTWVPEHSSGHLWVSDNNGYIRQMNLVGSVFEEVKSFSISGEITAIAHNGTDLWIGDYSNNSLTQIDDGILENEGWISLSSYSGTVTSSGSSTITATFNATGKVAGTHEGTILVSSNDPSNAADTVTYSLTISGTPAMNLSATSFSFGNVMVGANPTKELWITNSGCDTLKINDVNGLTAGFTLSDTAGYILPYDSVMVTITCSPTAIGSLSATLTILSNTTNTTISLSAVGVASPVMSVNPTSLSATVSCGGSTTKTFTVENSGTVNLAYSTLGFIEDAESSSNVWTTEVYSGTDDLWHKTHLNYHSSNTSWWCGIESNGNYENGNRINTALISPVIDLTKTNASVLDFWERYETEGGSYDWCMVDISTDGGATWAQLRGDGVNGSSNGWINTTLDLTPYCGNLVKIRFYFDTRDNEVNDYLGWVIDDIAIAGASSSANSWNWLTVSNNSGTIAPGGSSAITVNFNATGLTAGTHTKNLYVISNDQTNSIDTIACTFTVEGLPGLELSKNAISFPSVFVGSTTTGSLTISNPGCDTLKVTNIISSISDFTLSKTAIDILPGNSENIMISFTPSTDGAREGSLTIYSNTKDSTINISGTGIVPSVIEVTSTTTNGSYSEGDVVNMIVTFNTNMLVSSGTPQIVMNTTPTAYAYFVDGSGFRDLVFEYTVGANDNSADLDYADVNALTTAGSTLTDINGNIPNTTLPTVGTFATNYSIVIDNIHPTVTLTSNASNVTAQNPIRVEIEFSEEVTGLELADFTVGNGTASNLQINSNTNWTVDITPSANGIVTVDLPANAVEDIARNGNVAAAQFTRTYDSTLPLLTLTTTANPTNTSPIVVTITVNVSVTGLELSEISVTNGTASALTEVNAGTSWTVNVTPTAEGSVVVSIPAGAVINGSSNANPESANITITYDATAPTVAITSTASNPTNVSPIVATVTFSEEVEGFITGDITVGNGTAFYMEPNGNTAWTIYIAPTTNGVVTADIAANVAIDLAGNGNAAATQYSVTYDGTLPEISSLTISNITNTTADVAFTATKNAEVYYAVLTSEAAAPSASDVVNGVISAVSTGHTTVTKDVAKTIAINGLAKNTAYVVYSVAVDMFGNKSVIASENFTTTNTEVDTVPVSEITIYPNPVSTSLQIKMDATKGTARYNLYSITGRLLNQGLVENGQAVINMENYTAGVYILRIDNGNSVATLKVIKM